MAEKNTFLCMKAEVKENQVAGSSGVFFFFAGGSGFQMRTNHYPT